MKRKSLFLVLLLSFAITLLYQQWQSDRRDRTVPDSAMPSPAVEEQSKGSLLSSLLGQNITPTLTPTPTLPAPPSSKTLSGGYHTFQTFNNCGPAALSMALSYYGIQVSQQELGQALRPYQNPHGDNDDKSVTLEELAAKAGDYDLLAYHRPNGTVELIKNFLAQDMPVITRTWTAANEDIGHFRVVKGYDEQRRLLIQDDSLQGHDLTYSYTDFNTLWEKFNYEFLVLVPREKQALAESILGANLDESNAWTLAKNQATTRLAADPSDIYARFNLAIAAYHLGDYQQTVNEYEQIAARLPARTLWYQIEPLAAYYRLGDYQRLFTLSEEILSQGNRAYSELYLLRGQAYQQQGQLEAARIEYEKAVFYNRNSSAAQAALAAVTASN